MAAPLLGDSLRLFDPRRRFLHAARHEAFRMDFHRRRLRPIRLRPAGGAAFPVGPWHHGRLLRGAPSWLRHLSFFHREEQADGVNPEPFLQLDRVIHERGRLAIMSLLAATPQLAFTEMRDTLNMTDGHVTAHLRTLHEA